MNRDSLASHLGHHSRMVYFAVAENQSLARMKYNFVMVIFEFWVNILFLKGYDQTLRTPT